MCTPLGGDCGTTRPMMVAIGLLLVGGQRLEHLNYIARDPISGRFCGLARIPTAHRRELAEELCGEDGGRPSLAQPRSGLTRSPPHPPIEVSQSGLDPAAVDVARLSAGRT
jgi:hypothetical protein